jgi:hypothetical protein
MNLFWRNGYQAQYLSDLLNEMKIGRGSFYPAFFALAAETPSNVAEARRPSSPRLCRRPPCNGRAPWSRIEPYLFRNAIWRKAMRPVLIAKPVCCEPAQTGSQPNRQAKAPARSAPTD